MEEINTLQAERDKLKNENQQLRDFLEGVQAEKTAIDIALVDALKAGIEARKKLILTENQMRRIQTQDSALSEQVLRLQAEVTKLKEEVSRLEADKTSTDATCDKVEKLKKK